MSSKTEALRSAIEPLVLGMKFPLHAGVPGRASQVGRIFDVTGDLVATVNPIQIPSARHNAAHAICLAMNTALGYDTANNTPAKPT